MSIDRPDPRNLALARRLGRLHPDDRACAHAALAILEGREADAVAEFGGDVVQRANAIMDQVRRDPS